MCTPEYGAFNIPAKTKPVFHNLNKVNEFCESHVGHYELGDEKVHRNKFSDLKLDTCTPNGKDSNGDNVVFTFSSDEGVTVNA